MVIPRGVSLNLNYYQVSQGYKKFIYTGNLNQFVKKLSLIQKILIIPIFRICLYKNFYKTKIHIFLGLILMKICETFVYAIGLIYHRYIKQKNRIFL
jgi:hypothetical protein